MICPTEPPNKKIRKIPPKFEAKAIQGHVPWLNLKKNFLISFSKYANNVGTPLFRRQAQNTDTYALNQLGVSQNSWPCDPISLLINTFGIHLEPACKSHGQIIHYLTAKNVPKQATVLLCL